MVYDIESINNSVGIFKLLSDETRMKILVSLLQESKTVNEIVNSVHASQSGISHQLKLLKEGRIVKSERVGKCIRYSLDDDHIKQLLLQTLAHSEE